ncbi:MAG: hypothetical protein ABI763_00820 [Bacteroidota bacterium]
MTYTIEIDTRDKAAKNLFNLLKDLSKTMKGVNLIETIKDDELLFKMIRSKKSGRVTKEEMNKTLKGLIRK